MSLRKTNSDSDFPLFTKDGNRMRNFVPIVYSKNNMQSDELYSSKSSYFYSEPRASCPHHVLFLSPLLFGKSPSTLCLTFSGLQFSKATKQTTKHDISFSYFSHSLMQFLLRQMTQRVEV